MIIIDKIINKYNKEEIYKLLPRITARNIIFNRKELINFREKFKITHPVLYEPIKKKFHLAFDGMLADYLKLFSKS